jgi:membrane protease YdiL (CAAX protease family)
MNVFDDDIPNQTAPPNGGTPEDAPLSSTANPAMPELSQTASSPAIQEAHADEGVPEDLRISWSWAHLIVFLIFSAGSLFLVQVVLVFYFVSYRQIPLKELERTLPTQAPLLVAIQIVWFALVVLFLYMTLGVLRNAPFWSTLGWRRFRITDSSAGARVWGYLFAGCGLAIIVGLGGSGLEPKEKIPIQELLKDPHNAVLFMLLAVLVAPVVEETLFRGYLYPLFARKFGVGTGIAVTGVLFGLMHGSQLGWTFGLVALLTVVGLILTYVRARTGTVLASYLVHFGYNLTLALPTFLLPHIHRGH